MKPRPKIKAMIDAMVSKFRYVMAFSPFLYKDNPPTSSMVTKRYPRIVRNRNSRTPRMGKCKTVLEKRHLFVLVNVGPLPIQFKVGMKKDSPY
jgi:hypothetical protein